VIGAWCCVLVAVWAAAFAVGGKADNSFSLPGAQSERAIQLLTHEFPQEVDATAQIVYRTPPGTTIDDEQSEIQDSVAALQKTDGVATVISPFDDSSLLVAHDGRTAVANVVLDQPLGDLEDNGVTAFDAIESATAPFESPSLSVSVGGELGSVQPIATDDVLVLLGLLAALVVLLVTLRAWAAFTLPVLGAVVGIGVALGLMSLLEAVLSVPTISSVGGVMIGLGVGIDYGLFVVARQQDAVRGGRAPRDATGPVLATAGRAVLTAGSTVVVALLALLVFDVPAVSAIAYAVLIFVVCVVLSAVTLQPAVLAIVGERVVRPSLGHAPEGDDGRGMRWARFVARHAPAALVCGVVLLLVLAVPVFAGDLRLGPLDSSQYPTDSTQYRAFQQTNDAFGPGFTDPFLLVAQLPAGDASAEQQLDAVVTAVEKTPGVAAVLPPRLNTPTNSLAVIEVIPTTGAQDAASADLVTTLRDDTLPAATAGTGIDVLVSGSNAVYVDLDDRIAERLPLFVALVCIVAIVILMVVFRSLLIPLKAAVFDLLTILAVYGVMVAVFSWGWGRSVLGVPQDGPMISLLAPVIFAVLFGLSNDYEVYLLTRMQEVRANGVDARSAVVRGHGHGSRIIVGAALIMIFVFASFAFQPGTSVKQFGFGMAVAILLDAFVTRMVMLPAAMYLGGERMWWLPRFLERLLVRRPVENPAEESGPTPAPAHDTVHEEPAAVDA
jgi:RND superfamily putative drug exporter